MATPLNTTTKSITLKPGETYILPADATNISSTGEIENECNLDITNVLLKCYDFIWELTNSNGAPTQSWDHEDSNNKITSIVLNNNTYTVTNKVSEPDTLKGNINAFLSSQGVFAIQSGRFDIAGDRDIAFVKMKTTDNLAKNLYITIKLSGSNGDIRIYPVEADCIDAPLEIIPIV